MVYSLKKIDRSIAIIIVRFVNVKQRYFVRFSINVFAEIKNDLSISGNLI